MDRLNSLIAFVLRQLGPVKRTALTHRLWITITGDEQTKRLRKGEVPGETRLEGESEALREFGVGPGEGITLKEFYERSEFKMTLDYYIPHLANALRRVIEQRSELWCIPPVILRKGSTEKILVPAYYEKGLDNSHRFEFLVYRPVPRYFPSQETLFYHLQNLFFITWNFRWRIIDFWLERLLDRRFQGDLANTNDVHNEIRK